MWPQENSRYNTGTKPAGGGGSSRVRRSRLGEFQASDIGKPLYQARIILLGRQFFAVIEGVRSSRDYTKSTDAREEREGRELLLSRIDYVGRQSRERIENDDGS